MAEPPRFAVVLPVEDDRGLVQDAIRGWNAQTFPRDRVEIILVTGRDDPAARGRLVPLLATQDRWLPVPGGNHSTRYDAGARAARADYLIFTESHCVPEPDLLAEVERHLAAHAVAGVCCRSRGVAHNALARLDERLHEEGIDEFKRAGDWRKVDVHAFVLSRRVYEDAGGFDHRYDRFSERVLALRLHEAGHQLDYLPSAVVRHFYRTAWAELFEGFRDYSRGEVLYRWSHPGPDRTGFTYFEGCYYPGSPESPLRYGKLAHELGRGLASAAGRLLLRRGGPEGVGAAWARLLAKWGPYLPLGPRWARWSHAARLGCSILGVGFGRVFGPGLETSYRALWRHGMWGGGLKALACEPLPAPPELGPEAGAADVHDADLFNWHGFESFGGRWLRWSDELSAIRLRIPARDVTVHWELLGIRPDLRPGDLQFFCNGRPLDPDRVELTGESLRLHLRAAELRPDGGQQLAFYCRPATPWRHGIKDFRRLGLPLIGLRFEATEAARRAAA